MSKSFLTLILLIYTITVYGQGKLIYGSLCKCKSFAEQQNLRSDIEEIGVYEAFPELISPNPDELDKFLKLKFKKDEPKILVFSLKIDEKGVIDCIHLDRGDSLGDQIIKLSEIISNEFKFAPAVRRGKPIESIYIFKVSI